MTIMVKYGPILLFLIGLLLITIYFLPMAINAVKETKKEIREDSSSFFKVYSPELLFFIGPLALLSLILFPIMSLHIRRFGINILYLPIIPITYTVVSMYLLRSTIKSRQLINISVWKVDTVLSLLLVCLLIVITICAFLFYSLELNTPDSTSIVNT